MSVEDRIQNMERPMSELDRRTATLLDLIQTLTGVIGSAFPTSAPPMIRAPVDDLNSRIQELKGKADLWFG